MCTFIVKTGVCLFSVPSSSAGRPFAMELLNPHRSRLSRAEMKQLQEVGRRSLATQTSLKTLGGFLFTCVVVTKHFML